MPADESSNGGVGQQGFWSYVRRDDDDERQRISQLAQLLSDRVRHRTGEAFPIFLDRITIGWGADWEARIDEALLSTTFFIPIITPSYFLSEACREELLRFTSSAKALGLEELVLPIYYTAVPELDSPEPSDELMRLVKRYNWELFQVEALEDIESSVHRKGVDRLARRLLEAAASANAKPTAETASTAVVAEPTAPADASGDAGESGPDGESEDDQEESPLEILAAGEEAIARLNETMTEQISPIMGEMGAEAEEATKGIQQADNQGKGFAGRLRVSREYAVRLTDIADRLEPAVRIFLEDLLSVDAMVQLLFRMKEEQGDAVGDLSAFIDGVRSMAEGAETGLGASEGLADSVRTNASWSKDLRRPSARIETALRQIADARLITRGWLEHLE